MAGHGIIDLPKFNYEDLEEIVAGGRGSYTLRLRHCFYCLFHTLFLVRMKV